MNITIRFDGGCRPTNPGNKYGSYSIENNGRLVEKVSRVEFGFGTNNEAEFNALIAALDRLCVITDGYDRSKMAVCIFTDSTILMTRIKNKNFGGKSEPAKRMASLAYQCVNKLMPFKAYSIDWVPRERNVETFGH